MIKAIDRNIARLNPNVVVAIFVVAGEGPCAVEFASAVISVFASKVRGGWVGVDVG